MAINDDSMKCAPPPSEEPSHILDAMKHAMHQGDSESYDMLKMRYREYVDRHAQSIFKPMPNIGKPFVFGVDMTAPARGLEEYQAHLEALAKVVEWFRCHQALDPLEGAAKTLLENVIKKAIQKTYKEFDP